MHLISTIDKKILNKCKKEALSLSSKFLGRLFFDFDEKFFNIIGNPKIRPKIFDLLNTNISLQGLNYIVCQNLEKKFKKKFINWTFPHVRIDSRFSKNFSAPIHRDEWILDTNRKGYIVWFPLTKNGGSLLVSKRKKLNKIIPDKYWGFKSVDKNILFEKVNIKYGQMLIFDSKTIHKSVTGENRISAQFRYEVFDKNFRKRSNKQVVDNDIQKYWLKKHNT